PIGIPHTDAIFKGLVRASMTIAMLQPVCSPERVVKPEMVSARIPQQKRKSSRFFSIFFAENGRIRTAQKMTKRPIITNTSMPSHPTHVRYPAKRLYRQCLPGGG